VVPILTLVEYPFQYFDKRTLKHLFEHTVLKTLEIDFEAIGLIP